MSEAPAKHDYYRLLGVAFEVGRCMWAHARPSLAHRSPKQANESEIRAAYLRLALVRAALSRWCCLRASLLALRRVV